ncbi:tyrosine-type recombinase/integrase [Streptomyces telluris]|uniref:Site-specific integrase n=1 Tax=Streptomyces telluris TaxID=2720021 RepID=A0A9X2LGH5_9ACTN|nr:site-specific integrase [Streptomyces telluris]MCQ8770854.1 site-specific integrase [Streptomyces telluris]NJP78702.1 site-specific integrase [Streptomyces telluris]
MLTYDVKFWAIRQRDGRAKPYQLRWVVGPEEHSKSYRLKSQAEGRLAELMAALRNREPFDTVTGLPDSELRALNSPTWYAHARDYVEMKWPTVSAKHRASIAESLATVTPTLVKDERGAPTAHALRTALYAWAFRLVKDEDGRWQRRTDLETPPEHIAHALDWIARKSLQVTDLDTPVVLRSALRALSLKMDGTPAAPNTVNRKIPVFSNALRYAVELDRLDAVPLGKIDWSAPEVDDEIDFRYVPGPQLTRQLLEAVADQGARGRHLRAFFGCIYYAGARPAEVVSLALPDCTLPDEGWGELVFAKSTARIGSAWTNTGESFDSRGLKRRARNATRTVPIPPILVRMLRRHIEEFGTAPDGRLFRAARGGLVLTKEYGEIWTAARRVVLTSHQFDTPLAETAYSARRAGISLWLKSGVAPAEVARRAGHSIAVLHRFYNKIINGHRHEDNARLERALTDDIRSPI